MNTDLPAITRATAAAYTAAHDLPGSPPFDQRESAEQESIIARLAPILACVPNLGQAPTLTAEPDHAPEPEPASEPEPEPVSGEALTVEQIKAMPKSTILVCHNPVAVLSKKSATTLQNLLSRASEPISSALAAYPGLYELGVPHNAKSGPKSGDDF